MHSKNYKFTSIQLAQADELLGQAVPLIMGVQGRDIEHGLEVRFVYMYMYTCIYVYLCIFVCICMHFEHSMRAGPCHSAWIGSKLYIYLHVCVYVCLFVYVYLYVVCICVCVLVYCLRMCMCIYVIIVGVQGRDIEHALKVRYMCILHVYVYICLCLYTCLHMCALWACKAVTLSMH